METKRELYLEPIFDSAKSFYKKAKRVIYYKDNLVVKVELYSYNTLIATLKGGNMDLTELYSDTTLRHIKEFIKQYFDWFNTDTREELKKLNGNIKKGDIIKLFM